MNCPFNYIAFKVIGFSVTENDLNRRVIHMEFTDQNLPSGLEWKEMIEI